MIVHYYLYDTATGEILRTGECPEGDVELQPQAGESVGVGETSDATHFVVDGQPVEKPYCTYGLIKLQIYANGIDEFEILNLPDNCFVTWPDGVTTEVDGGKLQYTVDYPGVYTFSLESPIHLPVEVSVEAVALS